MEMAALTGVAGLRPVNVGKGVELAKVRGGPPSEGVTVKVYCTHSRGEQIQSMNGQACGVHACMHAVCCFLMQVT